MNKLISTVFMLVLLSACAFNPVQYEEMRQFENQQHDRMMG